MFPIFSYLCKNNQLIIVKILFLQTNKSMKIVKTSKILKMLAKDGWVLSKRNKPWNK